MASAATLLSSSGSMAPVRENSSLGFLRELLRSIAVLIGGPFHTPREARDLEAEIARQRQSERETKDTR